MKATWLFVPVALLAFSSCERQMTCGNNSIILQVGGFTDADFVGAQIFSYPKDGTFSAPLDSMYLSPLVLSEGHNIFFPDMDARHDYRVYLPALAQTYLVTNIRQDGHRTQSYTDVPGATKDIVCFSHVVSCNLNGIATAVKAGPASQDTLFLQK